MYLSSLILIGVSLLFSITGLAQDSSQSGHATRKQTATATQYTKTPEGQNANDQQQTNSNSNRRRTRQTNSNRSPEGAGESGVVAVFDSLINGIQRADVNSVTSVYWNSPQLVLFNNNGTVTKGWEQLRKNRESSYPQLKNVRINIRDRRVEMLGASGAVVTCLWTQSDTFRGTPETASGRMTIIFRRLRGEWKAIHLHTSPDRPDPSRVAPSEQVPQSPPAQKPSAAPESTSKPRAS